MTNRAGVDCWNSPDWLDDATAWIDACLADHRLERTEPLGERRVRSWATVISVMSSGGLVWFKAASGVTAHEARIYPLLASVAPDVTLTPLGIDLNRAWMLLPDGGTSMRHTLTGDALVSGLVSVVPRYADLQIALMNDVGVLAQAGVDDMRPMRMANRFDAALDACRPLVSADERETFEQIRALRSRYVAWCARLDTAGIAATLDHSDLHTNNILLAKPGDIATARIYDWGDSVLAHPFSSLLVLMRSVAATLEAPDDDPRLACIRDAYLAPFGAIAPDQDLVDLADVACRVAIVTRATTWLRVLELAPPADPDWVTAPWDWMKTLLQESWIG